MGNIRFLAGNYLDPTLISSASVKVGVQGLASKVGTGGAILVADGTYWATLASRQFIVEVNDLTGGAAIGQAKFRWKHSEDAAWVTSGITTSGSATYPGSMDGIGFHWTSGGGTDFVAGDTWTIPGYMAFAPANIVDGDRDTDWRSSSAGGWPKWVTFDLGSARQVDAFALLDHNLTSAAVIKLKGGNVDLAAIGPTAISQANTHLSLVDGTAFVDLLGVNLAPYIGRQITITDSAGKTVSGWLKAAGGGETLGYEKIANAVEDTVWWLTSYCSLASVAGGFTGNCMQMTRTSNAWQKAANANPAVQAKWLVKISVYVKSGSSGDEAFKIAIGFGTDYYITKTGTSSGEWVQHTFYGVIDSSHAGYTTLDLIKDSATAGTMLFDDGSIKQVLTPSATGCTIVSSQWGTTYNWTSEDAGFNPNDPAGYTYTIGAAPYMTVPWAEGNIVYYPTQEARTCQVWQVTFDDAANPDGYVRASEMYLGPYSQFGGNLTRPRPWTRGPRTELIGPSRGLGRPRGILAQADVIRLNYATMPEADKTVLRAIYDATYDQERGIVVPFLVNWDSADPADVRLYEWETPDFLATGRYLGYHDWALNLIERPRLAR